MNSIISYGIILVIIFVWFFLFFKKKTDAMVFLIYSTIIYYAYFSSINIDLIIKILFLITISFSCYRYGISKVMLKIIMVFMPLFFVGTLLVNFSNTYTIKDNITAMISTLLGFLIVCVNWPIEDREKILEKISFIPIVSIVIGILIMPLNIIPFFSRVGGIGLGGASMATNLSFYCVTSIMTSLCVYKINNNLKYRILAYINFVILLLTLTRGGILAGFFVLLPDLLKWSKESMKSGKKFLCTCCIILVAMAPMLSIFDMLLARSFSKDGSFNSSGRFEAWEYMINMVDNEWIGNGFGYLKTFSGDGFSTAFNAAHNEYIRVYLETGIIGFMAHFLLFYFSFKSILKNSKEFNKNTVKLFMFGFLLYSLTDNTITNYRFWIPYLFSLCMLRERKKCVERLR